MGHYRAAHAATFQAGTAAELDLPRDPRRHLLCSSWRHSLAADAHRPAAVADRLWPVRGLARQRLFETNTHALVLTPRVAAENNQRMVVLLEHVCWTGPGGEDERRDPWR